MAAVNIDKLVEAHQAIKDARTAKRHAWEAEDALLDADMQLLKTCMLGMLNATGTKSMACDSGTVYRREVLKPSAADWSVIWEWAKTNNAMEIFEKRLKVGFIQDYMEANDGALPPGINAHRTFEVSVRRPTDGQRPSASTALTTDTE